MEFKFTPEQESFREEVRAFIQQVLPPQWEEGENEGFNSPQGIAETKAVVKKLASSGWLTMAWPKEYGGMGAPLMNQTIFQEEAAYRSLPTDAGVGAVSWVAPTLMIAGTDEQKEEHLPPIAQGDRFWCTLYSEPGAGSDLAGNQSIDRLISLGGKISIGHRADQVVGVPYRNLAEELMNARGKTAA